MIRKDTVRPGRLIQDMFWQAPRGGLVLHRNQVRKNSGEVFHAARAADQILTIGLAPVSKKRATRIERPVQRPRADRAKITVWVPLL